MSHRGESLYDVRRRLLEGQRRVTTRQLEELDGDPRAGARALAEQLRERRRKRAAERRRIGRLFRLEREYRARGVLHLAGVDEVGMGPLAGPVVAAAVILPERFDLSGLDDSKRVPVAARERLAPEIRECAVAIGIGRATASEIDDLNIYQAGLLAMRRAVRALSPRPEIVLVDARVIPALDIAQRPVKGGDARVGSIAAASIVAKVDRDATMKELDRLYPGYGFAQNSGYGTAQHLRALAERGATPQHRCSFAPVREARRSG